jgi:hypothetical protein
MKGNAMTIEEKLKQYILSNYKSIREFVQVAGLPYTTMDGILKRGIANASIGNVLKICKTLQISADELANERIVPLSENNQEEIDLENYIKCLRQNVPDTKLVLDGEKINPDEYNYILDGVEFSIEMIKKSRKRRNND